VLLRTEHRLADSAAAVDAHKVEGEFDGGCRVQKERAQVGVEGKAEEERRSQKGNERQRQVSPVRAQQEQRRENALIVAALPTKLLTTVGPNPVVNPLNPSTLSAHFSALGLSAPVARPADDEELGVECGSIEENAWYTHVEG
jgi:hypothetical protein